MPVLILFLAGLFSFAARAPAADAKKELVLVSAGEPRAAIVVADNPDFIGISCLSMLDRSQTTRLAAEYIQLYVKKIAGAELPIITASNAPADKILILVGRSRLTEDLEAERKKLAPEGFLIRVKDKRVYILGEIAAENDVKEFAGLDRGTLFGAFEFLERCGVRWYFPGDLGVVVPETKTLAVPPLNLKSAPAYRMRWVSMYYATTTNYLADPIPVYRNGNATGFWTVHTYDAWRAYAKDHPEFFGVDQNGKSTIPANPAAAKGHGSYRICFSEPGVFKMEMERARAQAANTNGPSSRRPELVQARKYVQFFPPDLENIYHCSCPRCRAQWDRDADSAAKQSTLSPIIFGYAAKFAAALDAEYPGKRLAIGAYCGFLFPTPKVELPDNVDVLLCTVKGNSLLVHPAYYEFNTQLVDAWLASLDHQRERLYLWEYFCYPSAECFQLYPHVMQRWFRDNRTKINGAFNNTRNLRGCPLVGRFDLINDWLWCKLLWNPDLDVDAALSEMYAKLFGPAEAPMKSFFDLCVARWEGMATNVVVDKKNCAKQLNPGAVSYVGDRTLYGDIYPPEVTDRLRTCLQEARRAAPEGSVYARRIDYFGEAIDLFLGHAEAFYRARSTPPRYTVVSRATLPAIDGKLDDAAWQNVEAMALKSWRYGLDAPTATSLVYAVRDTNCLYFAARLSVPSVSNLVAKAASRDDPAIFGDDRLVIDFDLRSGGPLAAPDFFRVMVNPAGVFADGVSLVPVVIGTAHCSRWNEYWNPEGVRAAAGCEDGAWTVELAIPVAAFPLERWAAGKKGLRVQFIRENKACPAGRLSWSPMLIEEYEYDLDRMGTLLLK